MNLNAASFLKIAIGASGAAVVFWAISFLIPKGMLGTYEEILGLQLLGAIFGAVLGAAATVIAIVVSDSRRPETGAAANFTMINGMGSMLIGKSDVRDDGSYVTTEWFCLLWLPLFPVCNYRIAVVSDQTIVPLIAGPRRFVIMEKHPVRLKDMARGYVILALMVSVIGLFVYFLRD